MAKAQKEAGGWDVASFVDCIHEASGWEDPAGGSREGEMSRPEQALETITHLASELLEGLEVTSDKCAGCGQHTQPAKASYQAQKQLESIIRQADRLLAMESAGLLPWRRDRP